MFISLKMYIIMLKIIQTLLMRILLFQKRKSYIIEITKKKTHILILNY